MLSKLKKKRMINYLHKKYVETVFTSVLSINIFETNCALCVYLKQLKIYIV